MATLLRLYLFFATVLSMILLTLNLLKRRERKGFKEGAKERERIVRLKQLNRQREQRLSRRRIRDRARREAQSVEQRQTLLQRRRERLNAESGAERDVRLQQMREVSRDTRACFASEMLS